VSAAAHSPALQLTTAYWPVAVYSSSTSPSTITRQVTDVPVVCAPTPAMTNVDGLLTVRVHGAGTVDCCEWPSSHRTR
jgi:hypothetical protein